MISKTVLEGMTLVDKISVMELLWDDICRSAGNFPSPEWHGELLRAREEQLENGQDKFEDWDNTKKDLWDSLT